MGKTVILGASDNPARYSYKAAKMLSEMGFEFEPVGLKKGMTGGKNILDIRERPVIDNVETITLYMNPFHQREYYDYIISLKPRRIIFNPGTENPELLDLAAKASINTVENCTLIMLGTGSY